MKALISETDFICRVCGEHLTFNRLDPSTFLSKTEHEDFVGMQLTTYRVAHTAGNERHHNAIVVDHMGFFRGQRDAYTESLLEEHPITESSYWMYYEEKPSESNDKITLALLISKKHRWIVDVVCPENLKPTELTTIIMDRLEEAWRIYDTLSQPFEIKLADLDVHVWSSDNRLLVVSMKDQSFLKALNEVAYFILDENEESIVPRRQVLDLVLRILGTNPNPPEGVLSRILTDDMLLSKIHTPYEDRIPSIVDKTGEKIPIAREILGPLLRGYITVIEILENKYVERYEEVFELIDFINRRRLLG